MLGQSARTHYRDPMAEQTTSSIVIDAPPADVMAVIADFEAYPEWAQGMKSATVLEQGGARADQVRFELDASPIKDSYTLAYDWDGDRSVTWELVEGRVLARLSVWASREPVPLEPSNEAFWDAVRALPRRQAQAVALR